MRRQEVSFPLAFRLFLPAHLHRAIRAVFGPVGVGRKRRPADGAAFDFVPAFGDFGAQGRVQRQDGHPEPPAQQRIGNTLHTDTFLPIVQQEAVSVTVVAALMGEPAGLAVLGITHVLALVRHIHSAENDVVMQMALVYVGGNHIGVFALQHFIGKLPPDLMGLFRRGFPRFKGLYQVVGQIVALLVRLI